MYRVCKHDKRFDGPLTPSLHNDKNGPYAPDIPTNAVDYLLMVTDHVRTGSRKTAHNFHPFLSATSDLDIALWWSVFGTLPVVVDVRELTQPYWSCGIAGSNANKLYEGTCTALNFATASKEITVQAPIAKQAYKQLEFKWTMKLIRERVNIAKSGTFKFPQEFKKQDVTFIKCFDDSSTQAVLIKIRYVSGNKSTPIEELFVAKRGGRTDYMNEHVQNEFIANLMYDAAGIKVPEVGFYLVS